MAVELIDEQIRLYARLLKLPTFVRYPDILRRVQPNARFDVSVNSASAYKYRYACAKLESKTVNRVG